MSAESFRRRSFGTFLFSLLFLLHLGLLLHLIKAVPIDGNTFHYLLKCNRKAAPFLALSAAGLFTLIDLLVIISPVYSKHYSVLGLVLGFLTGLGAGLGLDLKGGVSWLRNPEFLVLWSMEAAVSVALMCHRLWRPFVPFNAIKPELPELASIAIPPPVYYPSDIPTRPTILSHPSTPTKARESSIPSSPFARQPQFFSPAASMIN
jgi:hypothetical protein